MQTDFILRSGARRHLDLLERSTHSLQVADMGDAETYGELGEFVDRKDTGSSAVA